MELEILNQHNIPAKIVENRFLIIDTESYSFRPLGKHTGDAVVLRGIIGSFGEDMLVPYNNQPEQFFLNYLGVFAIFSTEGQKIAEINIVTKKLNEYEASKLFEYVYDRNLNLFRSFLHLKTLDCKSDSNNEYKEISFLRYLEIIKKFIGILEDNYKYFNLKTAYKLTTEVIKTDYNERTVNIKSVEWILSNLDEFQYGVAMKYHPNVIKFGNTYALPQKMVSEVHINNLNIYENRIIKGAILNIGKILNRLSVQISQLTKDPDDLDKAYASFKSLKRGVLKSELLRFEKLQVSYNRVKEYYFKIFDESVLPIVKYPKMTHVFKKKKHYNNTFFIIQDLYQYNINYTKGVHDNKTTHFCMENYG